MISYRQSYNHDDIRVGKLKSCIQAMPSGECPEKTRHCSYLCYKVLKAAQETWLKLSKKRIFFFKLQRLKLELCQLHQGRSYFLRLDSLKRLFLSWKGEGRVFFCIKTDCLNLLCHLREFSFLSLMLLLFSC